MKRWSSSLAIREVQIKTTSCLLEWLLSTRQVIPSVGEVVEKKEPSFTDGGKVKWYRHYGKQYGNSSKN